jgi:hypothetical protein
MASKLVQALREDATDDAGRAMADFVERAEYVLNKYYHNEPGGPLTTPVVEEE